MFLFGHQEHFDKLFLVLIWLISIDREMRRYLEHILFSADLTLAKGIKSGLI
jgi:hypothetical protein